MSQSTTHFVSTMASDGAAERVDPPAAHAYTFPVVRETPIPSAERVGDPTW